MSGNQESGVRLPTWRCSDFNAAIPIKKRKYFVQPQLLAVEEAGSAAVLENNEQGGDSGVGRSGLDSSDAAANQKVIGGSRTNVGEPVTSFRSVSVGNVSDKAESIGNISGQIRVKVEEPNFPVHSSSFMEFEIPYSSNILGGSLPCSLGKLPVSAEHPGVVVTSDKTGMKGEQSVLKTNDIVREGETEASSGAGTVSMRLGCETKNSSLYWEKEEPTALNFSLSKGVYAPHNTDCVSTCIKSENHIGVNRSNWDLNTTMDAWEDGLDRRTRVKTAGAFLNSNKSLHDTETSSGIAKSDPEKQKESVGFKSPAVQTLMHQVNPTCSLSLGLGSYPSLSATTSGAITACTSSSRPITMVGNLNSVNLRTVKSEVIEESLRQIESAQICPIGLSINRVKQEVVGRISQEKIPSSSIMKLVKPVSIKPEPISFSQSEVFNRKDGTLTHFHTPVTQSDAILDLPTSSTPNQKDKCIPLSNAICNAAINQGVQRYSDCTTNENSGQSSSAINGKGPAAIFAEGNEVAHAEPGSSETEQRDIAVPFHNHVEEKGSETAVLGKTGNKHNTKCASSSTDKFKKYTVNESCLKLAEMGSTEVDTKSSTPELERGIDGLGENEGRIVQDGEQSTHQIIHASEGTSGASTVSGGNGKVENPENVNNSSSVSYKEEISTIDNDAPMELSEGSQSRRIINLAQVSNKSPIKTLDASGSFVPLQMERERLPDFPLESQRYLSRGSDESCKFQRERYHGKVTRSPRLNFMPDRRRFSDQTESNLHDRDTKNFEFDNHGNTRRGGTFNFRRGRLPADDEGTPFSNSFQRRTPNFSFRGQRNKEDTSAYSGFRDGEKATRGLQSNNTEPIYLNAPRPYRGRNGGFARGHTNFSDNTKRSFPGFRSRSPVRSRERSTGPSSSFRNRSQEDFGGQKDFSHRRSPSGYRTERTSSPENAGYSRETLVRRHNSPPYSHRPSNAGRGRDFARGRGFSRGRGYVRGRGYGRYGDSFRKPSDRVVYRNLNPRERVNYGDDFFEGPIHSERFDVDVNVERRRFGYRHDETNSFRLSFNKDGCAPTNVENDPDAVRFGQDPHIETDGQGSDMEIDGENNNSAENTPGGTKNTDEEETSKQSKIWQHDELGGDGF